METILITVEGGQSFQTKKIGEKKTNLNQKYSRENGEKKKRKLAKPINYASLFDKSKVGKGTKKFFFFIRIQAAELLPRLIFEDDRFNFMKKIYQLLE